MNERLEDQAETQAPALATQEEALRRVLERLVAGRDVTGQAEWEIVGRHVLALAERDALDWPSHASEFIGAYAAEVIALFRRYPQTVADAERPWGLAVAKGRLAGRYAVGLETLVGLTGRDEVSHRVRMTSAPRVVSLENLAELGA